MQRAYLSDPGDPMFMQLSSQRVGNSSNQFDQFVDQLYSQGVKKTGNQYDTWSDSSIANTAIQRFLSEKTPMDSQKMVESFCRKSREFPTNDPDRKLQLTPETALMMFNQNMNAYSDPYIGPPVIEGLKNKPSTEIFKQKSSPSQNVDELAKLLAKLITSKLTYTQAGYGSGNYEKDYSPAVADLKIFLQDDTIHPSVKAKLKTEISTIDRSFPIQEANPQTPTNPWARYFF